MNPTLKRLAVMLGVTAAAACGAEFALRRQVPDCGVTPFRISALTGLTSELRPGFATRYKGVDVRVNSLGARGPEFPARGSGVLRIALVGDSYTFGTAVVFDDTLGECLRRTLEARGRPAQVLNLGVPGYSAPEVAAVVEHRALDLDVDVIVYVFYANDIDPPVDWQEIPPDAVIDGMHGYTLHSALAQWTYVMVKRAGMRTGRSVGRRTQEFSRWQYEKEGGGLRVRGALTRMRDACRERGVRFVVAVYPEMTRRDIDPFRPIDEAALRDARAMGLETHDLLDAFPGEPDLWRYRASVFDGHPNRAAHTKVAEYLARSL